MIAFNYNINFQDEPSLNDIFDPTKETITITQSDDANLFSNLAVKSAYLPLSGRDARYGAEEAFERCLKGCAWGVEVKGVLSIVWKRGEHRIVYLPHAGFTPQLLAFWMLHTILPMLLTLEERYSILHVGSVEVKGKPIIFSADSFGGKSTLTDFFIQQGHTLLSDDTLGVYKEKDTYMAVASYPFHRPYREAESLGYKTTNVLHEPKPIDAVYILEKVEADAEVHIETLRGVSKYKAFHMSNFINFDFLKQQRFEVFSKMANTIVVYKVTVPWDIERLFEVYKAIVENTKK